MVTKIETKEKVNEVIKSEAAIIDCFATWCGPCRMLSPIIEDLSESLTNINFYKLDVDELGSLVPDVYSIPTLIFYKNGKEQKRVVGFQSKESLLEEIRKVFD